MTIQVLYFDDCPHFERTFELVERTVQELNVAAEVELVKIETPEVAAANRFLGSPAVHVDGVDIDPDARDRTDYGMACRRYDGLGIPPREMIAAAIKRGNGGS